MDRAAQHLCEKEIQKYANYPNTNHRNRSKTVRRKNWSKRNNTRDIRLFHTPPRMLTDTSSSVETIKTTTTSRTALTASFPRLPRLTPTSSRPREVTDWNLRLPNWLLAIDQPSSRGGRSSGEILALVYIYIYRARQNASRPSSSPLPPSPPPSSRILGVFARSIIDNRHDRYVPVARWRKLRSPPMDTRHPPAWTRVWHGLAPQVFGKWRQIIHNWFEVKHHAGLIYCHCRRRKSFWSVVVGEGAVIRCKIDG